MPSALQWLLIYSLLAFGSHAVGEPSAFKQLKIVDQETEQFSGILGAKHNAASRRYRAKTLLGLSATIAVAFVFAAWFRLQKREQPEAQKDEELEELEEGHEEFGDVAGEDNETASAWIVEQDDRAYVDNLRINVDGIDAGDTLKKPTLGAMLLKKKQIMEAERKEEQDLINILKPKQKGAMLLKKKQIMEAERKEEQDLINMLAP